MPIAMLVFRVVRSPCCISLCSWQYEMILVCLYKKPYKLNSKTSRTNSSNSVSHMARQNKAWVVAMVFHVGGLRNQPLRKRAAASARRLSDAVKLITMRTSEAPPAAGSRGPVSGGRGYPEGTLHKSWVQWQKVPVTSVSLNCGNANPLTLKHLLLRTLPHMRMAWYPISVNKRTELLQTVTVIVSSMIKMI